MAAAAAAEIARDLRTSDFDLTSKGRSMAWSRPAYEFDLTCRRYTYLPARSGAMNWSFSVCTDFNCIGGLRGRGASA